MKILHCADIHCKDSVIDEATKCLDFMVETAAKEEVDLIIVAGDVFDSGDVKLDSKAAKLVVRTFNRLADIAPVAVIIGTPSHDGTAAEVLSFVRGSYPIHVATKPEQIFFLTDFGFPDIEDAVKGECDAVISLIPAPTKQYFQGNGDIKQGDAEIAAAMSAIFAGMGATASGVDAPHILVGHYNTAGSLISEAQILTGVDIEISPEMMGLSNATTCLLGHIHFPQQIKQNIFYSGSLFPLTWGENYSHGLYIHEIGGADAVSRFIQTPHRKMIRTSQDLTSEHEQSRQIYDNVAGAHLRMDFTVWQDEAGTIDKEALKQFYMEAGALDVDIRINRIPRENIRADEVLKAEKLSDKIIAMAALRGETVPESILVKCDALELMSTDNLIGTVTRGEAL